MAEWEIFQRDIEAAWWNQRMSLASFVVLERDDSKFFAVYLLYDDSFWECFVRQCWLQDAECSGIIRKDANHDRCWWYKTGVPKSDRNDVILICPYIEWTRQLRSSMEWCRKWINMLCILSIRPWNELLDIAVEWVCRMRNSTKPKRLIPGTRQEFPKPKMIQ